MSKEIISAIEAALSEVTALDVATAQLVRDGDNYECPFCEDGYLHAKDYTNIDDVALGIQFFGIGKDFGNAEKYLDAVLPGKMRQVLGHVAALEALALELAGALDAMMSQSSFGGIRFDSDREPDMAASKHAARAALSSPLLAELRAKEAGR